MTKHLTAVLILGLACCTGTAQAEKPVHPQGKPNAHPVRHDLHKINRDRQNLHQDGQALHKDEKDLQQDRQKLESAWKTIKNDYSLGQCRQLAEGLPATPAGRAAVPAGPRARRKPRDSNSWRIAMNCGTTSGSWAKTCITEATRRIPASTSAAEHHRRQRQASGSPSSGSSGSPCQDFQAVQQDQGELAQDRQALNNDYGQQQEAREKLQADLQNIKADFASGNTTQLQIDIQQLQQDHQQYRQDRAKTEAGREKLSADRRELRHDEWQLEKELLNGGGHAKRPSPTATASTK